MHFCFRETTHYFLVNSFFGKCRRVAVGLFSLILPSRRLIYISFPVPVSVPAPDPVPVPLSISCFLLMSLSLSLSRCRCWEDVQFQYWCLNGIYLSPSHFVSSSRL